MALRKGAEEVGEAVDYVKFGRYPQMEDGEVRPVEWQVLARENNKALVIRPNVAAHLEFGEAWLEAAEAGVKLLFVDCNVTEDSLTVDDSRIFLR